MTLERVAEVAAHTTNRHWQARAGAYLLARQCATGGFCAYRSHHLEEPNRFDTGPAPGWPKWPQSLPNALTEIPMITKLLLAYDGSAAADEAFAFALDLAGRYGAEMHILAVAHPPDIGSEVETEAIIEGARRHFADKLKTLKTRVGAVKTHFEVKAGHPAEQIVIYAEGHGIDHIVVGHRGHSLFERWLLGSVARQVIAYAHCAVTVVRSPLGGEVG